MLVRSCAAGALLLLLSCSGSTDESPSSTASASLTPSPNGEHALFLVPEQLPAIVGTDARLQFRRGDLRENAPLARLDESFDPFMARVGGVQHNVLEPDVEHERAGITHRFGEPGDAMVGFSTRPRLVEVDGEQVQLSQHVKALLFVSRDGRDLPRHSAAMSHRLGLQMEIVPMIDPLPLLPGDPLPIRLRFNGPGIEGATVRAQLLSRKGELVEHFAGTTDSVGSVRMPIGDPGRYLVTAAQRVEVEHGPDEVHYAALTFDVGAKR